MKSARATEEKILAHPHIGFGWTGKIQKAEGYSSAGIFTSSDFSKRVYTNNKY